MSALHTTTRSSGGLAVRTARQPSQPNAPSAMKNAGPKTANGTHQDIVPVMNSSGRISLTVKPVELGRKRCRSLRMA